MIFKFSSLYDYKSELYSGNVVIILGDNFIFNKIVTDRLKKIAIPDFLHSNIGSDLSDEFVVSSSNETMNSISLEEFIRSKDTYPMMGRWFCFVMYDSLSKSNQEFIKEYIKNSKDTGILVINCSDYRNYKLFRANAVKNSKLVNLIDLSYPDRTTLKIAIIDLLTKLNNGNKIPISDKALELFIMRMGSDYNGYYSVLQKLANDFKDKQISYDDMLIYLKGIDNYNIDEFIERLVTTKITDKFIKTRKVYKAYYSLCEDLGIKKLISRLNYKLDAILEMRYLINTGEVPILVRYGVKPIQDKLDDTSKLKKLSSFAFKKLARLASLTSLRDWFYIKMMLNKYNSKYISELQGERIMHDIIHRGAFSSERINNDIAILDSISSLYEINKIRFKEA